MKKGQYCQYDPILAHAHLEANLAQITNHKSQIPMTEIQNLKRLNHLILEFEFCLLFDIWSLEFFIDIEVLILCLTLSS